jgi:hypothetical protein
MLTLRTLPIGQLRPAPYNPRVPLLPGSPGWRRLERSLQEFDLVQPIVWNEQTGHVVSGHQRLEILKHHGHTEVEVAVVSLALAREQALNVTLNNAQVGSDWDAGKLTDLVAELQELPDFDATLTGFDAADLHALVLAPEPTFREDEPDESATVQIRLEIAVKDWPEFRPALDAFVNQHPLQMHVRLPR